MTLFPMSAESFDALAACTFDAIAVWAPKPWRIVYANAAFRQLGGGARRTDVSLASIGRAMHGQLAEIFEQASRDDSRGSVVTARLDLAGDHTVDVRLCRLTNDGQMYIGMIIHGMTLHRPEVATGSAHRDPLTGLLDREFVKRRIAELLAGDRQFAVLFIDLNHFKRVNDEFGHLVGDDVLREAAQRIANALRHGDQLSRYGGDEFVAVVEDVEEVREVESIVRRIHAAVSEPIVVPEGEASLSISVGHVLASSEYRSAEDLLAAADRAMYAAKPR